MIWLGPDREDISATKTLRHKAQKSLVSLCVLGVFVAPLGLFKGALNRNLDYWEVGFVSFDANLPVECARFDLC